MKNTLLTFIFTGLGYLSTLIYTYFVLNTIPASQIGEFNRYESFFAILIALVSLGIVQDASRNIALAPRSWLPIYHGAQLFRLIVSFFIFLICLALFFIYKDNIFLLGIVGVFIALSGEYVFYALGRPVEGSIASFLRASSYSALIILCIYFSGELNLKMVALVFAFSFLICGLYVSLRLNTSFISLHHKYLQASLFSIGFLAILIFLYNTFKPAYIFLIYENLSEIDQVYYFEAFKIFFLLFSVRRVCVQIFYKKIIQHPERFRYDGYITFMVMTLLSFFWIISFIINYFNLEIEGLSYKLLRDVSIMTFLMCFFPSSFTKLFSLKKDYLVAAPVLIGISLIIIGSSIFKSYSATVSDYLYLLGATEFLMCLVSFIIIKIILKNNSKKQTSHYDT